MTYDYDDDDDDNNLKVIIIIRLLYIFNHPFLVMFY